MRLASTASIDMHKGTSIEAAVASQIGYIERRVSSRLLALDSLRGIAALSVMVLHYLNDSRGAYGLDNAYWQFGQGNFGVQLFFMISGFVILQTLDRRSRVLDFAVARFIRLYPTFWSPLLLRMLCLNFITIPISGGFILSHRSR